MITTALAKCILIITFAATTSAGNQGEHSCADGDGSCSAEVPGDGTTNNNDGTINEHPPSKRKRGNNLRSLPKSYLSQQLEHIDEQLRDEAENTDPIITCDDYLDMEESRGGNFVDPVAITNTLYQEISWAESTEKPDKCLTLDDTLQICNSYRPHYHEYFVHFPAAFLPQMKRAIFVGGGDSMLLHELLKYPDLELIVGLELDQAVVRDSLKHFFTQPKFEMYPKVQWWFGDAAKSLLMLPKEWYGTFDLVMVDLSETVMSVTVSEELDILRALSLLLEPGHGIFVKNEKYLEELGDIFDHVIQIYLPDTPLLCDQDWVFGSFGVDFLHPDFDRLMGKYEIATFDYKPREDDGAMEHHALIRDYAKNDVSLGSHCAAAENGVEDTMGKVNATAHDVKKEGKKFGVFMAIEAENAMLVSSHKFALEEALLDAIKEVGSLQVTESKTYLIGGQLSSILILQEGYIMVRAWPQLRYCAFDVTFWSRFELLDRMRDSLLRAVGAATPASTYRVVVGGMYGTDSWREDLTEIGPRKADCKEPTATDDPQPRVESANTFSTYQIVVQESLALIPVESDQKEAAVVFCGIQSESECESLEVLSTDIDGIIAIWSCSKDASNEASKPGHGSFDGGISLCGKEVDHVLKDITSHLGKLNLVVIDPNIPSITKMDIANALTKVPLHSDDSFLAGDAIVILRMQDKIGAYFLEQCRLNLADDLMRAAVVSIEEADAEEGELAKYYLGYLTLGNPVFLAQLVGVMDNISKRTSAATSLVKMKGSPVRFQSHYSAHHYTMFDYDEAPGMKQYAEQMPLGKQTLLQMKFKDTTINKELLEVRSYAMMASMNATGAELSSHRVGNGIIVYAVFKDGHMITVWDGHQNIDMNIYSNNETVTHRDLFEESFMKSINLTSALTLWEEQPRGVGRAINFSKDVVAIPGCVDRYIICDKLEEFGECEVETEKQWMLLNCPLACDRCPGQEGAT